MNKVTCIGYFLLIELSTCRSLDEFIDRVNRKTLLRKTLLHMIKHKKKMVMMVIEEAFIPDDVSFSGMSPDEIQRTIHEIIAVKNKS